MLTLRFAISMTLLWSSLAAAEGLPRIMWDEIMKGAVSVAAPYDSIHPEANQVPFTFVKGSAILGGKGDRLAIHANVGGDWVENPFDFHMERLSILREDGSQGFTLQIPEASWDSLCLYVSIVQENVVQFTFPGQTLRRTEGGSVEFGQGGRELPESAVLTVIAQGTLHPRSPGSPKGQLPLVTEHIIPVDEGSKGCGK